MDIIGADNRRYVNLPLPPPMKFFRRFRAALAVAESENSFEDTPYPLQWGGTVKRNQSRRSNI